MMMIATGLNNFSLSIDAFDQFKTHTPYTIVSINDGRLGSIMVIIIIIKVVGGWM